MVARLSPGAAWALRRFAGWVARGSIGYPLLDSSDYWEDLRDSPSQMEIVFTIFANVLEFDDDGEPIDEKFAERRAAARLYQCCTGSWPGGVPVLEGWEAQLP